jgi:alkyl sulfatase BDS1-like metallo-beta-lactamase superfamily hydrolase
MPYRNLSAQLSEADSQEIQAALAILEQKLPFLISLTVDERRQIFKMGDKSLAFVSNCLNAAQSNAEILPRSFDLAEFQKDYQLTLALSDILTRLRQLTEKVDDTTMAVGSEALASSLTVYEYVKTAAKKTPGMKTLAEQLGERFKALGSKRKQKPPLSE